MRKKPTSSAANGGFAEPFRFLQFAHYVVGVFIAGAAGVAAGDHQFAFVEHTFVQSRGELVGLFLVSDVGEDGVWGGRCSFLFKEKERTKGKPFWRKTAFFGKRVVWREGVRNRVPAFTEPAPSWGAWKGLGGG